MGSRHPLSLFALAFVASALPACEGDRADDGSGCTPDDQDGVLGGKHTVLLTVSDELFAVGAVGSGSTQRNITIQNSSQVTLTLTNTGTKPHSLAVDCIPTGLSAECPPMSCFPSQAAIAPLAPNESATTTFTVPAVEGAYPFRSDVSGDEALVGQFVLN